MGNPAVYVYKLSLIPLQTCEASVRFCGEFLTVVAFIRCMVVFRGVCFLNSLKKRSILLSILFLLSLSFICY